MDNLHSQDIHTEENLANNDMGHGEMNVSNVANNGILSTVDEEAELAEAVKLKDEGNVHFRQGVLFVKHTIGKNHLCSACAKYAEALSCLNDLDEKLGGGAEKKLSREDLCVLFTQTKVSLLLNLAAAGIKLNSWTSAKNSCNAVLDIEPCNVKALFRRAQTFVGEGALNDAESDLLEVIKLKPNNQPARTFIKQVRVEIRAKQTKEEFNKLTLRGNDKQNKETNDVETTPEVNQIDEALSTNTAEDEGTCKVLKNKFLKLSKLLRSDEFEGVLLNGAIVKEYEKHVSQNKELKTYPAYGWGQNLTEISLFFLLPDGCQAQDIHCHFSRSSVTLKVSTNTTGTIEQEYILLDRVPTLRFLTTDECTWQLETHGVLRVTLFKEAIAGGGEAGYEWWPSPFEGHPAIDVEECSVGSTSLADLPDVQREKIGKAMMEEQERTPLEREERRAAEQEMNEAEQRRLKTEEIARNNPRKKNLLNMMRTNFPDIPVEFR